MKKLIIYLTVIAVLFAGLYALNMASGGSSDNPYGIKENKLKPSTRKQLDDPDYQNIILPQQLKSMLADKENVFVYFFSPECPHCVATTPLINPIADRYGVDLKKFNLLEFGEGWAEYGIEFTPTIVYFKDGQKADSIVGGMEVNAGDGGYPKQHYEDFFNKHTSQ